PACRSGAGAPHRLLGAAPRPSPPCKGEAMGETHRSKYPVISRRSGTVSTGVRLVGPDAEVFAEDRYLAGTPPVHGLDQKLPTSPRVSEVDVGDKLDVRLVEKRWQV